MKIKLLFSLSVLLFSYLGFAQQEGSITGKVIDSRTQMPVKAAVVRVENTSISTKTNAFGIFNLSKVPLGDIILVVENQRFVTKRYPVSIERETLNLDTILLEPELTQDFTDNLITLTENDLNDDNLSVDASSGLLQASRDIFLNRAAFDFGQAFFRVRGYDSRQADLLINGVPMNKLFNGRPEWNNWGGLNDVTRNQELSAGLAASDYTFGGVFGSTNINTKASDFRPGLRVSSSTANRTYTRRLMATFNSGLMNSGFAYTISASRRWADEGYIDGTLYDAYSVFGSLDYKPNDKHLLNATAFFTPNKRGSSTAITQEVFDLVDRRYNPNWGYQNGKKRNSRIRKIEEPVFMLSHFFETQNTFIKTTIAYQKGRVGRSRIQRFNAPNDRPDFFRYLPSFYLNNEAGPDLVNASLARENFIANPQRDWASYYQANQRFGGNGQSVYVLYDDVNADTQLSLNTLLNKQVNQPLKLNAGLTFSTLKSENYGALTDLLGGQFYDDIDPFSNTENNLGSDPRREVGDRILYNYTIRANEADFFGQTQFSYKKIDFFVGANLNYTDYQREGLFNNGQFADNSFGKGEKLSFWSGGIKAGFNYKISGKHFVTAHAAYFSQAPTIRNSFANARVNHSIVNGIIPENIGSIDASYIVRTAKLKGRLTAYYTQFKHGTEVNFFFISGLTTDDFVSETVTGVDRLHIGVELGLEAQITPTLKLTGVSSVGQYTFSDNAQVFIASDEIQTTDLGTSLLKNYRVAQGPQQAYALGVEYRDPKYWWIGVTANYLSNNYIDISPILRRERFVINPDDADGFPFPEVSQENVRELLRQRRLEDFFLMNAVGGKSWLYKGTYISLFASVNNVLNKNFRTGGFEQSRNGNFGVLLQDNANGTPSFGPRYFYGFGRTYFINLAVSF